MGYGDTREIVSLARYVANHTGHLPPLSFLDSNCYVPPGSSTKSIPIRLTSSQPARRKENVSPSTPFEVVLARLQRPVSAPPPVSPNTVKFEVAQQPPQGWEQVFPKQEITPQPKPVRSALATLIKSSGGEVQQPQARSSQDLLQIRVYAPDIDPPLSLVVPKAALVEEVIVSVLRKCSRWSSADDATCISSYDLCLVDEDGPDPEVPGLDSKQRIGSFGCQVFLLLRRGRPSTATPGDVTATPGEELTPTTSGPASPCLPFTTRAALTLSPKCTPAPTAPLAEQSGNDSFPTNVNLGQVTVALPRQSVVAERLCLKRQLPSAVAMETFVLPKPAPIAEGAEYLGNSMRAKLRSLNDLLASKNNRSVKRPRVVMDGGSIAVHYQQPAKLPSCFRPFCSFAGGNNAAAGASRCAVSARASCRSYGGVFWHF